MNEFGKSVMIVTIAKYALNIKYIVQHPQHVKFIVELDITFVVGGITVNFMEPSQSRVIKAVGCF